MSLVAGILCFVVILRLSIGREYQSRRWAVPYGILLFLTSLLEGYSWFRGVCFGMIAGLLVWLWLVMLDRTEGSFVWWIVFFPGLLIPVWAAAVLEIVV